MPGFFDDLVAATTADGPVDALTGGDAPADRQAVRTGAVLASAAVVSELARLADGGGRWTWQRLLRPGAAAAGDPGDPERGESLTRTLFGERAAPVAGVIARDAGLAPAEAERVLRRSTETAASLLADRVAAGSQPDLRAEAETLAASGWADWLTALAPTPLPGAAPDQAVAEPAPEPTPAEPAPEPTPVEPAPVAIDGPPEATPIMPAPEPEPGQTPWAAPRPEAAEPLDVEDGEQPSRRLLVAGAVTVAAVALLAVAVSTRFGGDSVDSRATATTATTTTPTSTEATTDLPTGATEAAPSTTAPLVPATAAPGPDTPVASTTYQLALADPQGSTDAAGTVRLDIDPATGRICYRFDVAGLTDPFPGHIHAAPTGASGGITVDFGYLTGATPSGCVDSFPADAADMIRHPERHYVELHDTEYGFGIRSRLAEEPPGTTGAGSTPGTGTGTAAGGSDTAAITVLSGSRVVLRGQVADDATRSAMVADTADLAGQGIEVVDELTVSAGAPPPSGQVVVEQPLLFPFDSNQLPDDAARAIDQLARVLELRPRWRVTLVGNTDGLGDVVYNLTLSLRRAIAARDALVAAGVSPEAVTIRGDGPFAPVADNATPDGRSRNRRIDVVITAAG